MAQSPTIAIPKKSTDEVDWTTPIRTLIAQSYGENPDNYSSECSALQRCRQDAVRGAGSDLTAASLLTKYFGQLELLELRFSEIRVSFPWRDAFTNKLTTQTSLAFEKASIIFQIAAFHSSIANSQNRSSPEGLKRAYHYFRTCAGMLTYINDNFLHAPSTDLSKEVIKFLVGITMAQANEVFFETCLDQRKSDGLIAKVLAHTASLYTGLVEEVKEFMGKGIFDRNWVTIIQIKAKYTTSLMHYYRSLADSTAGKHGEALSRLGVAESNAKEAHRMASSFAPYFVTTLSPTLPSDAGQAILDLTKAHLALCTQKKTQGQKDNDLIYNAPVPAENTLPTVDKIAAATPIPIQEVYGTPEVQKTIGPDLFAKLIPLSVHESASVYSEEKAKIVRAEAEKADNIENEVKIGIDSLGVRSGLGRFKEMAEGNIIDEGVPKTVLAWKDEVQRKEESETVQALLGKLEATKSRVRGELDGISADLENESRDCEAMRVKFEHLWTQEPSAGPSKTLRQDLKSHLSSLQAAAPSDQQIHSLWASVQGDIKLLLSTSQLEAAFTAARSEAAVNLLDVEPADDEERKVIGKLVDEIEDRLSRITKIAYERKEVLKDLKEKVQNDDVSHLLLLNRRNTGVEPTLFANELEKFRPLQTRLAAANHAQQLTLQEVSQLWKSLKDKGGRGKGVKKWEERQRKVEDLVKRFAVAREGYLEVREGIQKGLQFYTDLTGLADGLRKEATKFVQARKHERESTAAKLDIEQRLNAPSNTGPSAGPVPPPPPRPLESGFSSMSLGSQSPSISQPSAPQPIQPWQSPPPPAQQPQRSFTLPPPPPPQPYSPQPPQAHQPQNPTTYGQPYGQPQARPPPQNHNPYADMFTNQGLSSVFSLNTQTPSAPPPPPPAQASPYGSAPSPYHSPPPHHHHQAQHPPSHPPQHQPYSPIPPQQQYRPTPPPQPSYSSPTPPAQPSFAGFPPPPPPVSYSSGSPQPPQPQQNPLQPYQQPPQTYGYGLTPQQGYPGFPPPPQGQPHSGTNYHSSY